MKRLIGLPVFGAVLLVCVAGPVCAAEADRRDFNAPFDRVWQAAMATFNGNMLESIRSAGLEDIDAAYMQLDKFDKFEKGSGIIISHVMDFSKGDLFGDSNVSVVMQKLTTKPKGGLLSTYTSGRLKVTAYLRSVDDKTTNVKIVPEFYMRSNTNKDKWVRCKGSTGVLEKDVLELVASNLQ